MPANIPPSATVGILSTSNLFLQFLLLSSPNLLIRNVKSLLPSVSSKLTANENSNSLRCSSVGLEIFIFVAGVCWKVTSVSTSESRPGKTYSKRL